MTAIAPDQPLATHLPIAALQHSSGAVIDEALLKIVDRLKQQGYRLAGAVRARVTPPGEDRCDLFLEDLSTSTVFPMSQDLGSGSDACRLDDSALDAIAGRVEASLRDGADILILNKFGKQESEGRGLRGPIVKAVDAGIPVLVGVNSGRLGSWTEFCGGASEVFGSDDAGVDRWLKANLAGFL